MNGETHTAVAEPDTAPSTARDARPTRYGAVVGRVRVAVVDDHRLFLGGLTHLLLADPRFEVVGEALSGEDFLALECVPSGVDVVFMDIDMPGMGGVEATRRAVERWPAMKIVALSMHGDREFYGPMMEAGAKGFLVKSSEFAEVAAAARRVAAGGTYFSPELMEALMEALPDGREEGAEGRRPQRHGDTPGGKATENDHDYREPLSERETEVLPLVCEGLSNHEIARQLFISKRTVDKHRANILAKTGCKNTASLVIYAIKNSLIEI